MRVPLSRGTVSRSTPLCINIFIEKKLLSKQHTLQKAELAWNSKGVEVLFESPMLISLTMEFEPAILQ